MISLVRFSEVRKMEGHKRQRASNPLNFVPEEQLDEEQQVRRRSELAQAAPHSGLGILKDEGVVAAAPGAGDHQSSSFSYADEGEDEEGHAKSFIQYHEDASGLGNFLGPGDYRRQLNQWNSSESSLSDYSHEKYKRSLLSSGGAGAEVQGDAEERRVRSRSDQASAVLTNLLERREQENTDLRMNISARTLRPSGGKDRHSKVFTAKGPRDRRVRLSVSTAIQFYDVQDRLGYDQPSKAVEWLMKKAKAAIDELSQIPLPGIDRIMNASSSSPSFYHQFPGYSSSSTDQARSAQDQVHVYPGSTNSYGSSSELQELKGVHEIEGKGSGVDRDLQLQVQAVDENDGFRSPAPRHATGGSTRRGELATDITMSVGDGGARSNQVQAPHHHHHQHHQVPGAPAAPPAAAGLSSFSSAHLMSPSLMSVLQQRQSLQQRAAGSFYLYEAQESPAPHQRFQGSFHPVQYHQHLQQQQQQHHSSSLVGQQQNYLHQEFLQSAPSSSLPFGIMTASNSSPGVPQAKPYLDQFHSLKIAGGEKASNSSSAGRAFEIAGSFLHGGSTSSAAAGAAGFDYSSRKQQQQEQAEQIAGGFQSAENSQLIQSLEEHLQGANAKRD